MSQNWKPSSACIGGILSGLYFTIGELYPWWTNGNTSIGYVSRDPLNCGCNVSLPPSAQIGQFATYGDMCPGFSSALFDDNTNMHYQFLAEFNVKLPEGSTLYKQTLAIYMRSSCERRVYNNTTWQFATFGGFSIRRRAYSDSTTFAETNIVDGSGYSVPNNILSGSHNIPARFSQPEFLLSLGITTYNGIEMFGVGLWCTGVNGGSQRGTGFTIVTCRKSVIDSAFGGDFDPEQENDPNEDPDDNDNHGWDGGDGDHDSHSDIILDPDEPGAGTASSGFLTLYSASNALLKTFADSLYDTTAWTEIKKYFTHPLDWIVSCVMLPFPPEIIGSASPVWGSFTWPVTLSIIDQYKTIQCGKMPITEYWGNFMDYAPYTKIMIWLPYIGYRELDTDMVMGHILNLKYIIDCCTGDCTAILSIDVVGIEGPDIPKIVGQYYGNCGVKVPISQISHDALIQASISGLIGAGQVAVQNAGNVVSAAETGDPDAVMGIVNNVAKWGGNTAIGVINGLKPEIQHTGVCGMAHGFFSAQKPFIIKTIPIQSLPENFRLQNGYMTNRSGKLGDFDGYVEVESIQLNDVPAYEEELKEIIALLKGGVII